DELEAAVLPPRQRGLPPVADGDLHGHRLRHGAGPEVVQLGLAERSHVSTPPIALVLVTLGPRRGTGRSAQVSASSAQTRFPVSVRSTPQRSLTDSTMRRPRPSMEASPREAVA